MTKATQFELDHVFVCTEVGAPGADLLIDSGFTEGTRNVHRGQGTANRRFFFRNAMFELLWLSDPTEVRSNVIARTRLYERFNYYRTGASPFGICIRGAGQGESGCPFSCWEYRPPYLPDDLSMYIGENSTNQEEPLLIFSPWGSRADEAPLDKRQPLVHESGVQEISSVRITLPTPEPFTAALGDASNSCCVSFTSGPDHLMEIWFDEGRLGRTADFRREVPLILRW